MQRHRSLVLLACALLAALPSCRHGHRKQPNVLLVVIDTLRADRLGAYGNDRGLTPFLDELAKKGAIFRNAYATSSWTVPSVASIFTSRFPSQHHVATFESKVAAREVTLAETLQNAGYDTGGFSANFRLDKALVYAHGSRPTVIYTGPGVKARGNRLRAGSLTWFARGRDKTPSSAPRLLYLQYMEPHGPYEPPEPYRSRFARSAPGVDVATASARMRSMNFKGVTPGEIDVLQSLYDGEVASVDAELRTLFAALEVRDFLNDAVVIVTADHGEEFREHGRMGHGQDLYNETIRVPLLVVAPGIEAGKVVEDNVSLVDVAPTILDLAGLPKQPTFEGRSLVPLLKRRSIRQWLLRTENPLPDVISELPKTGSPFDSRAHSEALVRGASKLLIGLRGRSKEEVPELYDLAEDPGETKRLRRRRAIETLRRALEKERAALVARANEAAETGSVDEATKEKLRALGYQL